MSADTLPTSKIETDHADVGRGELVLTGKRIHLPLIDRVTVIHSQQASRISWHTHRRFEVLFLTEGATTYEFDDRRTVDLPGGYFLVIPPNTRHRGLHDVRHPVRLFGMMFDPSLPQACTNTSFRRADLRWLLRQFLSNPSVAFRMNAELRRIIRNLAEQVAEGAASRKLDRTAMRINICAALYSAARQLTAGRSPEPSRAVHAAIEYLDRNFAKRIQMEAVAKAARCSRARLFQIFKESTGLTPNDYLLRLRIKHAQASLTDTDQPVTTIAMHCGFTTSQYFSNVFRKYTGFTPSNYREQIRS